MQVTGVITNLVDMRRDKLREKKILLKVHDKPRAGGFSYLGQGRRVFWIIHGDPYKIGSVLFKGFYLLKRLVDILRMRRAHALDGDGSSAPDNKILYFYFSGGGTHGKFF